MSKTIGIIGSRSRDTDIDGKLVWEAFKKVYAKGDSICSGLCPQGGDRFAVVIADWLQLPEDKRLWFPADWPKHGKAAGFIRNTDIAKNSNILIASVQLNRTGGTEDTIKKFIKFYGNTNLILV